jgi:hypothetical protein
VGANAGTPDWDQRGPGYPRIVNGIIDIGAFEYQGDGSGALVSRTGLADAQTLAALTALLPLGGDHPAALGTALVSQAPTPDATDRLPSTLAVASAAKVESVDRWFASFLRKE